MTCRAMVHRTWRMSRNSSRALMRLPCREPATATDKGFVSTWQVIVTRSKSEVQRGRRIRSDDKRCVSRGGASRRLTVTTRIGDHPAYQVFECTKCGYTEWITATELPAPHLRSFASNCFRPTSEDSGPHDESLNIKLQGRREALVRRRDTS